MWKRRNKIKNIIFDLGGVLLDLDFDAPFVAFQKLNRNGKITGLIHFLHNQIFIDFEVGAISPDQFRDQIRQLLKNDEIVDAEIDQAWCSMLKQVPEEKVEVLRSLAEEYRLFLFSNTNAVHIPYFTRRFYEQHKIEWESLFEKTFYSHEINDRKPMLTGYLKVLSLAGAEAAESLFIDDLDVNIAAAAQTGMHVMLYQPGEDLREKLSLTLAKHVLT
jgi:glucose-1-phosphatase